MRKQVVAAATHPVLPVSGSCRLACRRVLLGGFPAPPQGFGAGVTGTSNSSSQRFADLGGTHLSSSQSWSGQCSGAVGVGDEKGGEDWPRRPAVRASRRLEPLRSSGRTRSLDAVRCGARGGPSNAWRRTGPRLGLGARNLGG